MHALLRSVAKELVPIKVISGIQVELKPAYVQEMMKAQGPARGAHRRTIYIHKAS